MPRVLGRDGSDVTVHPEHGGVVGSPEPVAVDYSYGRGSNDR
jgi:hypothetical protein